MQTLYLLLALGMWRFLALFQSLVINPFEGATREQRKLYVDVGSLFRDSRSSGTNRVTGKLAYELILANSPIFKVVLVTAAPWRYGFFEVMYETSNGSLVLNGELGNQVSIQRSDVFLGLDLSHLSVIAQRRYFSKLTKSGAILAFCVYDLLPIQFPQHFERGSGLSLIHKFWVKATLMADMVFAISNTVANEYLSFVSSKFPKSRPPSMKVLVMGSDIEQVGGESEKSSSVNLLSKDSFFLAVGTVEPRKRYDYVLSEFSNFWEGGASEPLVIVGKPGWLTHGLQQDILVHQKYGSKVIWLTDATDADLHWLYRNSKGLIAASDGEGFGLPIREIAHFGGQVIANDIPVFREVAPETSLFFDNRKQGSLEFCLRKMTIGTKATKKRNVSALPTWKSSAEKILQDLSS